MQLRGVRARVSAWKDHELRAIEHQYREARFYETERNDKQENISNILDSRF
jgi:hypothetical protein